MAKIDHCQITSWFIYLIRLENNALYCGITTDVNRRFEQHKLGKGSKLLRGQSNFCLVWSERAGNSRSEASKAEFVVKKLSKIKKEALVRGSLKLSDVMS